MSSLASQSLLNPAFLRQLEQLQFVARRILKGRHHGERRSHARGQSVEFADFRNYSVGDDLRYLDWNLYARLERLFLKLYEEEQELRLTLFVDGSESMGFGTPPKLDAAKRLAAALGYVALCNFDAVNCVSLGESGSALRVLRNRQTSGLLFDFLEKIPPTGRAGLNASLRRHAASVQRGGLAIVLSDFLEPEGFEDGLTALQSRGGDVFVFHILSAEEERPDFGGDFRMVDCETAATVEVSFPRARQAAYEKSIMAWRESVQARCRSRGMVYLPIRSDMALEDVVLRSLRKSGALK
jgi:uncharacterized protein (DUF58 family)